MLSPKKVHSLLPQYRIATGKGCPVRGCISQYILGKARFSYQMIQIMSIWLLNELWKSIGFQRFQNLRIQDMGSWMCCHNSNSPAMLSCLIFHNSLKIPRFSN